MVTKYLINIVSLMRLEPHFGWIPECMFRRPNDLITDALEAGYTGVQAIPIRGLTGNESEIGLFEGAWNPVDSLWQAIRHHPGASGMPSYPKDWLVSPGVNECYSVTSTLARRGIREIHHRLLSDGKRLVEVSPKLDATPTKIAEHCEEWDDRLVIDTSHLREQPSLLGSNKQEWLSAIDRLIPYVDVIHVNPGDDALEMHRFLTNSSTSITGRLLRHLFERLQVCGENEITVVAEPRPVLRGDGGIRQAEKMLTKIRSYVG